MANADQPTPLATAQSASSPGASTDLMIDVRRLNKYFGERQVLCDFRPDAGIRLGPHFFTSDDELRFAIDQIGDILATGAHERHTGVVAHH